MPTTMNEDEYIARLEMEKRKMAEERKQSRLADEEKNTLKELHYMRCPKCGMELSEIDFRGFKIDKCFGCDGIWLDAGELESVSKLDQSLMIKVFDIFRK